ncbi:hypothetical protein EON65_18505 [archaeon]|nr:MAG: hypothetical protein EON65_18505 [archaeon]
MCKLDDNLLAIWLEEDKGIQVQPLKGGRELDEAAGFYKNLDREFEYKGLKQAMASNLRVTLIQTFSL